MKKNWPDHRQTATAGAIAALLWTAAPVANALTLGRAVIQSPLGETMRAEIEFENLNAEEAESLRANIASAETYRLSGVDYNPSLSGARVVLQRLANRRASLRITSDRVIQEPFLELILELNWRGGRLVRTYTLLFDLPPATRGAANPAVIGSLGTATEPLPASPSVAPSLAMPESTPAAAPRFRPEPNRSFATRPPASRRGPPPVGAPPAPPLVNDPYRVRPGDTLSELAQRGARPAGVSLDRLVLAMYRQNPDAFLGGNMHRLRNGVVLSAPSASVIDGITDAEARQVIRAQSADFGGYRSQLAAMATERPETSTRRASGKIQAAVEDRRQSAALTPDKLTLTKPSAAASADADSLSRQRARDDAATRVAELSKNVQDLGRLSGMSGTSGAGASQPAAAAPSPAAVVTSPPASGGLVAPITPAVPSAAMPAAPASGPAPAQSSAAPPAAASASRPRPPVKPAAPPPEPGLVDSLLQDNLPAVGLAGALLALLAGLGVYRLVKRRRAAVPETSFLESKLKPDSFFGASGGQRIDTREAAANGSTSSMMNYSLSQLDAIGDVDPVAEADVYLAYGRDLQAEEILKEAMRTTPERISIRTKLLEVYAKRRDVKGFEQLALQLHALTGGEGADWAKARELGQQIDPDNPLYGADGARAAIPSQPPEDSGVGMSTLPQTLPPPSARAAEPTPSTFDLDLDLDLGMDDAAQTTMPIDTDATVVYKAPAPGPASPTAASYAPRAEDMLTFVTPTGFGALPAETTARQTPAAAPATSRPAPLAETPSFNASAFSLDLDLPEPSNLSPGPSMLPPIEGFDAPTRGGAGSTDFDPDAAGDSGDPLARKLELADEFRQIGDMEGARDLLQEVIDRADGALKAKAEAMLASLS